MTRQPEVIRIKHAGRVVADRQDRLADRGIDSSVTSPERGVLRLSWTEDGQSHAVDYVEATS